MGELLPYEREYYERGYKEGFKDGFKEGYDNGYEAGFLNDDDYGCVPEQLLDKAPDSFKKGGSV